MASHKPFPGYVATTSVIHRLDPRSKFLLLLAYSLALFFISSLLGLFIAAVCVLVIIVLSRIPLRLYFGMPFVAVYALSAITLLCNCIPFSFESLPQGIFFALRIILLALSSMVMSYTTASDELLCAFLSFLHPFEFLGHTVYDFAMALCLAVRFIPVTAEEFSCIKAAHYCRCVSFDRGSLLHRLRAHASLMIPMFVRLFRRADILAQAMQSRCYGVKGIERSSLNALSFSPLSVFVLCTGLFVCATLAVLF